MSEKIARKIAVIARRLGNAYDLDTLVDLTVSDGRSRALEILREPRGRRSMTDRDSFRVFDAWAYAADHECAAATRSWGVPTLTLPGVREIIWGEVVLVQATKKTSHEAVRLLSAAYEAALPRIALVVVPSVRKYGKTVTAFDVVTPSGWGSVIHQEFVAGHVVLAVTRAEEVRKCS